MDVGTLSCHPSCHSWQVNTSWGSPAWGKQAQEAEIRSRLQSCHFLAVELPKAELVAGGQVQGACIQPTYSGTSEKQQLVPDRETPWHGQGKPRAQLFLLQQSGRGEPAPATSPAGSDFVIHCCQGNRGRKGVTGAQAFSSWKSQAPLWSAWQDPGIQRGSEKYKAKRNVPR